MFAFAQHSSAQPAPGNRTQEGGTLFLLASNIDAPVETPVTDANATAIPTVLYSVTSQEQLKSRAVVLQAKVDCGNQYCVPEGVFSIHEVERYMIVEYPYDVKCCVIFIPKDDPMHFASTAFVPIDRATGTNTASAVGCGFGLVKSGGTTVCDLWELMRGPLVFVNGEQQAVTPTTTLTAVCKNQSGPAFIEQSQWPEYKNLRVEGTVAERCRLSSQDGEIVLRPYGEPVVPIMPFPPELRALPGVRAVALNAANKSYFIVSICAKDGIDRNTDVFVETATDGKWTRLPVLPVAPVDRDKMSYRLFDNWLVTSASAALVAALPVKETIVPDVLTVVETGKQRNNLAIVAEPRTTPDVATLPARSITLWNLADGRRIDLAIPEDDSEVVHIFDDHRVLLRIHDKLFFAEIQDSKLTSFTLAAFDSAIPNVHWAFYSPQ